MDAKRLKDRSEMPASTCYNDAVRYHSDGHRPIPKRLCGSKKNTNATCVLGTVYVGSLSRVYVGSVSSSPLLRDDSAHDILCRFFESIKFFAVLSRPMGYSA